VAIAGSTSTAPGTSSSPTPTYIEAAIFEGMSLRQDTTFNRAVSASMPRRL
jgi:hypothetical protein